MKSELEEILKQLGKQDQRPVFHSEADFQFALAWAIKEFYKDHENVKVRLEFPVRTKDKKNDKWKNEYIDIVLEFDKQKIPIELKYKIKTPNKTENKKPVPLPPIKVGKEEFYLVNQAARDLGRYDFLKDVERIQTFLKNEKYQKGYAILLTNDDLYWKKGKKVNAVDIDFHISEEIEILREGEKKWQNNPSKGTTKGREDAIELNQDYKIDWQNYSAVDKYEFRYLLIEIDKKC